MTRRVFSDQYGWDHGRADDSRWVDPNRTTTKQESPYGYSEFFLWGGRTEARAADDGLYSDRIWQWDRAKASKAWAAHLGERRWDNASKQQVSAFLSEFLGKPVTVTALAEGCNVSNGYPYWIVWLALTTPKPKEAS